MQYRFHDVKEAAAAHTEAFYGLRSSTVEKKADWNLPGAAKRLFTFKAPVRKDPGVLGTLGLGARWVGEFGRDMVFGSPVNAYAQFKRYRRRHGGSIPKGLADYVKSFYWQTPETKGQWALQALSLAPTVQDLYHAATTEDPNIRKGDVASAVTGIMAAPFTSRLGLVGSPLQTWLQNKARTLVQKDTPPYTPHYDPIQHGRLAIRGLNSYGDRAAIDTPT